MNWDAGCATADERDRLQIMAKRYCTCGWVSPLRVGKPECYAHALLEDQLAVSRLLIGYRQRARLVEAEFAGSKR